MRVWKNLEPRFTSCPRPSAIRRRITADPSLDVIDSMRHERMECTSPKSSAMSKAGGCTSTEDSTDSWKPLKESVSSLEASPTLQRTTSEIVESSSILMAKSPEVRSPSSVLHPPSSSKRRKTIRDYYG